MASAFVHRLFTRGHVKYVRFYGDRAADRGCEERHPRWRGGRRKRVSQSAVSRNARLDAVLFGPPPSCPFASIKNEGVISPIPCAWGTGKLKNATLTPLTYIRVDAHDGVHIFRVIARLNTMNRGRRVFVSVAQT